MGLLFAELILCLLQLLVFLHFEELVSRWASDQHEGGIYVREGNLGPEDCARVIRKDLVRDNLWVAFFTPLPDADLLVGFVGQCDQQRLFRWSEGHRDDFFLLAQVLGHDYLLALELLLACVVISFVDAHNGGFFVLFRNCEILLFVVRETHCCDALRTFDACNVTLSLLSDVVEDDVVAAGVDHLTVVVEVQDALLDIRFDTRHKPGLQDVVVITLP